MDPIAPFRLPWLAGLGFGAATLTSCVLLGYAMRRMRSRDRLAVTCWAIGGVACIGGGFWALHALAMLSLGLPGSLDGGWLGLMAGAAFGTVAILLGLSRAPVANHLRWTIEALVLTGGWVLQFELAARALPGVAAGGPALHMTWHAPMIITLGGVLAMTVLYGTRGLAVGAFSFRLWATAVVVGACTALAEVLALRELRLPPGAAALPVPGGHGISPDTVAILAGGALLALFVGVAAAWLDRHALRRNRALRESLEEAGRRLRDQALSDPLTRMPNRLLFEERLAQALGEVGDDPCALAVLFIDLDGFKPINDSYGHVAGDAVLREVGRRLAAVSREGDTVARVGGDEFLLMVVRPGHEAVAAAIAQRVLQALGDPYTLPDGIEVNLSASIGMVMYPEHGPASKLIANADAAMYAAKRAGGSTYAFFEPRMELDAREQLELQHDLRVAIERRQLELWYQPKVHGESGQVTGVEALLRWHHPVRGFVPPGLFIPVAERFGLIGAMGNWVIDEACRQLRTWQDGGLRMRIAVNLSVHQLRQDDLVQRIRVAVGHFGVDPQLLTFEITESVAMEDTQETMRAFSQLANVGVSLAIDDFGTGYSSLAYLRRLPARQLKIDRSFVQDLDQSTDALAVVDAVVKLAHALGLTVVAEGVETEQQRDTLLALRCDELQGYLFARPMPARLLTRWALGEAAGAGADAASGPGTVPGAGADDFRASLFVDSLGAPLPTQPAAAP